MAMNGQQHQNYGTHAENQAFYNSAVAPAASSVANYQQQQQQQPPPASSSSSFYQNQAYVSALPGSGKVMAERQRVVYVRDKDCWDDPCCCCRNVCDCVTYCVSQICCIVASVVCTVIMIALLIYLWNYYKINSK